MSPKQPAAKQMAIVSQSLKIKDKNKILLFKAPPMFIKNDHMGDRVTSYYHASINYKLSENKNSILFIFVQGLC